MKTPSRLQETLASSATAVPRQQLDYVSIGDVYLLLSNTCRNNWYQLDRTSEAGSHYELIKGTILKSLFAMPSIYNRDQTIADTIITYISSGVV